MLGEDSESISREAPGATENLDHKAIDFTQFESDVVLEDWVSKYSLTELVRSPVFFYFPIDVLTPVHPVGKGRTNITLIMPTIVQTDSAPSYAGFDRTVNTSRAPAVSVHFDPSAYGITATSGYVFTFSIAAVGTATFDASGYAGPGAVVNPGPKTITGQQTISIVVANVPPAPLYVALTQTAGTAFTWYSTSINHPPLVFQP
ncbi:MAG: hypothetical protein JWQ64_2638 [Subtercola sp.]|nr:hypothetical protein [Subtercola sp.]